MSNRTLAIAICLAVVTAALAWVTRPDARDPGTPTIEAAETFTLGVDAASICGVTVESGGYTAVVSGPTDWSLQLPGESGVAKWIAEPSAVRAMLRDLASVRFERSEGREPPREARPLAKVLVDVLDVPDGRTLSIEVFGPPLAGRVPVRVSIPGEGTHEGEAPVDRLRPLSIEDIASLATPRPMAVDGIVTALHVVAFDPDGGGVITSKYRLTRQAGLWSLSERAARVDQQAAGALVERIRSIRMAGIEVPVPAEAGSADIRFTISLHSELPRMAGEPASGMDATLAIGGQANIDGDVAAVATRVVDGVQFSCGITLDAGAFPAIPATPDTLLDPVPLPWPAGEAASISIGRADAVSSVRRTLDGWTAGDRPADTLAIRTLLAALGSAHPVALHAESDRPAIATITLGPIGAADPVTLSIARDGTTVIVSDGAADWTIDDADGSFGRSIDALAP